MGVSANHVRDVKGGFPFTTLTIDVIGAIDLISKPDVFRTERNCASVRSWPRGCRARTSAVVLSLALYLLTFILVFAVNMGAHSLQSEAIHWRLFKDAHCYERKRVD